MLKVLDLPPFWLLGALVLTWFLGWLVPIGLFGGVGKILGPLLALAGAGLLAAAVVQMVSRRTTVIPRRTPSVLVTHGVFRFSRNPIYLGDAMILLGAILWWDVPVALLVFAAFILMIQRRFILPEEAVLRRDFAAAFAEWSAQTNRWVGLRKNAPWRRARK